jgi:hypothetical protein
MDGKPLHVANPGESFSSDGARIGKSKTAAAPQAVPAPALT